MEDIIDIIVTETTNLIEITSQPTDEIIDVNIIDNREDITLNVTPTVVEININSLTGNFGVNWGDITGTLADQTDLNTVLTAKANLVDGKVPSSELPSYVDDVVEVANYAALPVTGEVGKIYITLDTNFIYRWTGSTYVEIKDSSAVWGAITGTLSNQTDLQNALNAKDAILTFSSPLLRSTNTVSIPEATSTINGYLSSTDWTTFNSKVSGSGTTNYIPKFTASSVLGNSLIYDNGTSVTINGTSGTAIFNIQGSQTAVSNIARGQLINPTLVASANNNVLVGLDIAPTFTNGAFTGVSQLGVRSTSPIAANISGGFYGGFITNSFRNGLNIYSFTSHSPSSGIANNIYAGTRPATPTTLAISHYVGTDNNIYWDNTNASYNFSVSSTQVLRINTTGNLTLQNGGTFTDAGYRLDVFGTARFSSSITANSFVKSGGTSSQFLKADGSVDSTAYLPLTGGTLTGNLNGTNITISNSLIAKGGTFNGGASAGVLTIDGLASDLLMNRSNTSNGASITLLTDAVEKWNIGLRSAGTTDNFFIYNSNLLANAVSINSSNSATTFASSVTATNFILSGATGNTGLYYGHTDRVVLANYTAGGIDFETNGGAVNMTLFPSGNLGVGASMTDSGYKLDVQGTGRFSGALSGTSATFSGRTNASTLYVNSTEYTFANFATAVIGVRPNNDGISALWLRPSDASNNVGTAIQSTSSAFTIGSLVAGPYLSLALSTGAATFSSSVTATGFEVGNGQYFQARRSSSNLLLNLLGIESGTDDTRLLITGDFNIKNGSLSTLFTVKSSGNVGIGTTAPASLFHIEKSTNSGSGSTFPRINVVNSLATQGDGSSTFNFADIRVSAGNGAVDMFLSTTYAAGTWAPAAIINVSTNHDLQFKTNNTERMRITSGGDLLINMTSGGEGKLRVSQAGSYWNTELFHTFSTQYFMAFKYNGISIGSIIGNGTTTSYNITSDYRLKQDLKPIKGLEIVNKIKVYDYEWKADNSRMDGVLAHELAEILPYAVHGIKDGKEMQGVDYSKIVPVAIKAIQETDSKVGQLEKKIVILEAEIQTLKNK